MLSRVTTGSGRGMCLLMALAAIGSTPGGSRTEASDGSIVGWGEVAVVPQEDLTNLVAVAAGMYHSLGLKADGSIVGWGSNTDSQGTHGGQCDAPVPNVDFVAVAAAGFVVGRAEEPDPGGPPPSAKDFGPPAPPKDPPKADFRKVRWGASIDEVKASETALPESETDHSLTYSKIKQWGVPGTVLYEFSEGKLIGGTFTAEGSTSFRTIWQRYSELERRLSLQYPRPVVNDRRWMGYKFPSHFIEGVPGRSGVSSRPSEQFQFMPKPEPADEEDLLKYCKEGTISMYVVWKNPRSQVSLEIGKDGCTVKMGLSRTVDNP